LLTFSLKALNPLSGYTHIWEIGRRYTWTAPIVAVGGLVCSALEGLSISLLIPLLGALMATPTSASTSGMASEGILSFLNRFAESIAPDRRLPVIAGVMLAMVIVKGVVASLNSLFIGWVDGRAAHDVRQGMAKLLVNVGYPFYLKNDPAELLTILSSQSWSATEAIRTVFAMVADIVAIVVFITLLIMVDWRLTLIALALTLPVSAFQNLFRERVRRLGQRVSNANHWLGERMLVLVDAFRMIKIFGQEQRELARFSEASTEVRRSGLSAEMFGVWFGPTVETLHASVFVSILLGAYFAHVPAPVLLAFLVLLYRLQPYIQSIEGARLSLSESETALDEVEWLLDPVDKPPAPGGRVRFSTLDGPIVFENVSFTYATRPATPALDGVNLMFQPGQATALIGRSGSGKTTLVNLICRLLHPSSGRILVGGRDLSDIDPISWRAHLGFAGQDAELIDGSIAENIAYGLPQASLETIREAAALADIDAFVHDLEKGYETRVGARGLSLSGGQRQRIGLARALVRRPSVLVLDEATNAIDGLSEQAILNVVRERNLTAIVVSHRASALSYCDQGVVIEQGKVVEAGALDDLKAYRLLMELAPA
jgi:ABC-type multidrug transport system fused ATPase/permease subunit